MSGESREMSLAEWVDTLPLVHGARDEFARLRKERDEAVEAEIDTTNTLDECSDECDRLRKERDRLRESYKSLIQRDTENLRRLILAQKRVKSLEDALKECIERAGKGVWGVSFGMKLLALLSPTSPSECSTCGGKRVIHPPGVPCPYCTSPSDDPANSALLRREHEDRVDGGEE
jgi:rubrerythrin